MTGLHLDGGAVIAANPVQQRPSRRKSVLAEPKPGLLRARDRPGRRIHHNEPHPGHGLHQIPARFDDRGLPTCAKNLCHACRRLPPESPTVNR
jgi:hypothetical protein